jgi:ribosomal-protein-alanine N-acetyltransferase
MDIRHMTFNDLYRVENIGKTSLPIYFKYENLIYIMDQSNYVKLVAVYNNIIIGFIIGMYDTDKVFAILSFAVDGNYRKHGVGKLLLQNIESIAKQYCSIMYLHVHVKNNNAISFYLKNGFKQIDYIKNYYYGSFQSDTLDALLLIKYI